MLRITIHNEAAATRFIVEGKLVGPWVEELRKCWQNTEPGTPLTVELSALTLIDTAGKTLLAEMHRQGIKLVAAGLMTQAIIEEATEGVHL
jgi:hypothetical protein